jgi:hypothetical protein
VYWKSAENVVRRGSFTGSVQVVRRSPVHFGAYGSVFPAALTHALGQPVAPRELVLGLATRSANQRHAWCSSGECGTNPS